jgi:hypothetical protein
MDSLLTICEVTLDHLECFFLRVIVFHPWIWKLIYRLWFHKMDGISSFFLEAHRDIESYLINNWVSYSGDLLEVEDQNIVRF